MLFNSTTFFIFLLIVLGLYFLSRRSFRLQNVFLLIASYIFYGWWDIRFLYLIILTTVMDYWCSLLIDRGSMTRNQFLRGSVFLVAGAFFCTTVQWGACCLLFKGWIPVLQVNWDSVFVFTASKWWVFIATTSVLGLLGLLGPWFFRFSRVGPRFYLIIAILVNLLVLGVFKYFNFFIENLSSLLSLAGFEVGSFTAKIILPVGISFFTFQGLSHTIDVYRKQIHASDSLSEIAVYLSFFPQLVAGPIERGAHLLPQFQNPRNPTWKGFQEGSWLIIWGLYKKVVVADNLARIVNEVFAPYDSSQRTGAILNGAMGLLAIYAFAFQIYCDFSGYTDIARGVGKIMGFDIMLNFNLPYFSLNPSDFWRRWHISLSSWLRDYLYIPLGGNHGSRFMLYRNLLLTMVLGGLWHGASWTFVLWGLFHGLILILYRFFDLNSKTESAKWPWRILCGVIMFHLVCFGWLLFRSQNLYTVGVFLDSIATNFQWNSQAADCFQNIMFYSWFLLIYQSFQYSSKSLLPNRFLPMLARITVWAFVIMSIFRLASGESQAFIYFAF